MLKTMVPFLMVMIVHLCNFVFSRMFFYSGTKTILCGVNFCCLGFFIRLKLKLFNINRAHENGSCWLVKNERIVLKV